MISNNTSEQTAKELEKSREKYIGKETKERLQKLALDQCKTLCKEKKWKKVCKKSGKKQKKEKESSKNI